MNDVNNVSKWNGNIMSLDLEMAQPSGKIIQIGAVVGNIYNGAILEEVSIFVNPNETLTQYIINLTGITQDQVDAGLTLPDAYNALAEVHKKHECLMNPITWGGGDSQELRSQLGDVPNWVFGRRWIDVKTLFVSRQLALQLPFQGGLAKSLTKVGLKFKGRKHNAVCDAENTFYMYRKLLEYFKSHIVLPGPSIDPKHVPPTPIPMPSDGDFLRKRLGYETYCQGGHTFLFSGNATDTQCHPDQTCVCGAKRYGDM